MSDKIRSTIRKLRWAAVSPAIKKNIRTVVGEECGSERILPGHSLGMRDRRAPAGIFSTSSYPSPQNMNVILPRMFGSFAVIG